MAFFKKIQADPTTEKISFQESFRAMTMTVPWNLFLLTVGALIASFGLKAIAQPHGFVSGGIFGTAMLTSYVQDYIGIGVLFALLNIPILALGWIYLSRRFIWYTIYSILVASVSMEVIPWNAGIQDHLLAAIATGVLTGIGSSFALRSLGCDGGLTIVSLILHNKFGINVGTPSLVFNAVLFIIALPVISVDKVLYSMIITYLTSSLMNYSMGMFDQRKLMFIISEKNGIIADEILKKLGRGCTFLKARGAFTKQDKDVLLTVVYNLQLRRVEDIIYQTDPNAFVIIENTQRVLGKGFSRRKQY